VALAIVGVGAASLLLLAAGVAVRRPALVGAAVAVCGAEYAVFLGFRGGTVDRWAPLVAAALFVGAELGYRAAEPSNPAPEPDLIVRSILWLVGGVLATTALGPVLLAAAGGAEAGLGLEALGVVAAATALVIVVALVARG
jgi:hypothetical protein